MGILGKMFRVFSVAGLSKEPRAGDRRQLQLQINEARRQVDAALEENHPEPGPILTRIDQLLGVMVDRNLQGQDFERHGQFDEAVALYEANVDDMFDGSHPYERLLIIYSRHGAQEDAERVARACLVHCTAGMSEKLRERCLNVLHINGE